MCLTLRPAKLTNTILYAAETMHQGRIVHVMGYQNRASNQAKGPNAMLLPIPSGADMGPDNMLDTSMAKSILKDYARTVREAHTRLSRGMSYGADGLRSKSVQVFDKGSYTIALAENATDLPHALSRIPDRRRPPIMPDIFAAYDKLYPEWKMALCAWDGTIDAEPLLWWYEPKDASQLFMPALDGHDGLPPKLGADVSLDHTLVVGSVAAPAKDGHEVRFTETIPDHLKPFLATKVGGYEISAGTRMKNGDFGIKLANVHKGFPIDRIAPPGQA
jgi:hypothetical protein